jgi:hypothetical protein
MRKVECYRAKLRTLADWDAFLLQESGLPGPRGNLELAQAVAEEGTPELFRRYAAYTADRAPVNSPYEFLAFCGVVGMGRLLAEGNEGLLDTLRGHASDPRWRTREAVAMALQRLGEVDMDRLISAMEIWADGTPFEQRAAIAALCEPRLLGEARHVKAVLQILDRVTSSLEQSRDRKSEGFVTLRKGLGYCWSVAIAALPAEGKKAMEAWLARPDRDVRWIMKENLKKNRLVRMDAAWAKRWQGTMRTCMPSMANWACKAASRRSTAPGS